MSLFLIVLAYTSKKLIKELLGQLHSFFLKEINGFYVNIKIGLSIQHRAQET